VPQLREGEGDNLPPNYNLAPQKISLIDWDISPL